MLLYIVLSLLHWALLFMSDPSTLPEVPLSPLRVTVNNDIESVAGYISGEYPCTYMGVNGTLYAGSTALYFLGTFFLFDKKLRLPWEDVLQVQKIDQGIQALTNDDTVYIFSGIPAP